MSHHEATASPFAIDDERRRFHRLALLLDKQTLGEAISSECRGPSRLVKAFITLLHRGQDVIAAMPIQDTGIVVVNGFVATDWRR